MPRRTLLFWFALLMPLPTLAGNWLEAGQLRGTAATGTWKALRDRGIQKQGRDYSCGAAALATLLRGWYSLPVEEEDILELLSRPDGATSLKSLADLARLEWDLRATGLALDFAALTRLRVPVIVYLEPRGGGHFSVLRGIEPGGAVWLADPSWGNRLLSEYQFRQLWETRAHPQLKGRALLLQERMGEGGVGPANIGWFHRESLSREIRRSSCRNCRAGLL